MRLRRHDQVFVGPAIEGFLFDAGLRRKAVAATVCVHPSVLYLWAQNKRPVPLNRLEPLAEALHVRAEALLEQARVVRFGAVIDLAAPEPDDEPVFEDDALVGPRVGPIKPRLWPERWTFDMDKLPPKPTPKPRSEFAQWRAQSALEHAGMVPTPRDRRRWECYCLWCGRGVGRDAVLVTTDHPERPRPDCQTCGGPLLVREVETAEDRATDSLMRERWAA